MTETVRASPDERSEQTYAFFLLAIPVVVWGTTPRMTAVAGPHTDPIMLTALRAAPTAVFLLLLLPVLRYRLPDGGRAWLWTAATGLLMVTVFLGGFTEAILRAGPGNAIVLASTSPFWVVLLSRVLLGERVSLPTIGGLLLGFAGIILVVWSQLGGETGGTDLALGIAFALAAACGWGSGTLLVKQRVMRHPHTDLVGVTTGQFLVGGTVLLALTFAFEGAGGTDWSSGELWLSVAYISIVGCGLATLAYFGALKRLSATRVTAWTLLTPVVAVLLEIVLGHVPRPIVLVGMAVTITGVAIVNLVPRLEQTEPALQPIRESVEGIER